MAHYDLEEQEQLDELKAWWKRWGNLLTTALVALAVCALAWQGWNYYQRGQSAQAAAVYSVLERALEAGDAQKARTAAGELTEKFGSTAYAALGALRAAQQSFEAGDAKTARVQLGWVVEHGKNEIRDMARLRLAALLLDEKAYDEALALVNATPAPAFAARYLDLKGDILVAQGKKGDARAAYTAARDTLDSKNGVTGELIKQKLDNLGEA